MSTTKQGAYLVTEGDEFFLGRVHDILRKSPAFGQGISFHAILMDIVQEIISDPISDSQSVTIEIR